MYDFPSLRSIAGEQKAQVIKLCSQLEQDISALSPEEKHEYLDMLDIKDDGSIWLNQKTFKYATGLRMVKDDLWAKFFGFPVRKAEEDIQQLRSGSDTLDKLIAEWEILSDSIAVCEAKMELLSGQDETISWAEFEAELDDLAN